MIIRPVGADLFHADGQTDEANLLVTFAILLKRLKRVNSSTQLYPEKLIVLPLHKPFAYLIIIIIIIIVNSK